METTLILLKPDCISNRHVGNVLSRFEGQGFRICGMKIMLLNSFLLREHYSHIADQPFFPEVEAFMQSSPVFAVALVGENVIARVRELTGPTDSRKAEKGTIRGDLGKDVMENVIHASDSPEGALIELKRFFRPEEIFAPKVLLVAA
jgi:nucleoside-diphosphate kinase